MEKAETATKRAGAGSDSRLLVLDERDNVVVVTARIRAGETVMVEGRSVTMPADVPLGHKLARRDIASGEKIVKYGAPIGSATRAIRAGDHAHVHNIKSDYTPTYHLEDVRRQEGGAA
jgi:altronate dehydratase